MALVASAAATLATAAYLDGRFQIRKDLKQFFKSKKALKTYAEAVKRNEISPWYLLAEQCKRYPDHQAIWTRHGSLTFRELHDQVARYGEWLLDQNIRPGDLVALYLHNSSEFIIIWFALCCIGAAPAFINYNLQGDALIHCLNVCQSKIIVVDPDQQCQSNIAGVRSYLESTHTKPFILDEKLKQQISSKPAVVPDRKWRDGMKGSFPYCLIYTSGTTGLPKGCAFTVARLWSLGHHFQPIIESKPGVDRWYCSMPLYHGTGAITSSAALIGGLGIALTPKFSVSKFWPDIHDSKSTAFIYVGETARYLLNAPPHPLERSHWLRVAYGNGLRPDVWRKLQERFNIPIVTEFFNSTEGMFSMVNLSKGPYLEACVGHHGLFYRTYLYDLYIPVKVDYETGDIWRDENGFAKRVPYDEGGEIIVRIPNKQAFQGYWRSEEATNKKFAHNVFKTGDVWYRTGDALRRTPDGHWHFLDRLGDTFRWKSENVSTAEVAEVLGKYTGIAEANVYGVLVPNHEGRAGCAALQVSDNIDYSALLKYARERLPRYAVPVFLRIVKNSTHIHNHKQNKVPLRKEGVDPALVGSDVILWIKQDTYVEFTKGDWEALQGRQVRL